MNRKLESIGLLSLLLLLIWFFVGPDVPTAQMISSLEAGQNPHEPAEPALDQQPEPTTPPKKPTDDRPKLQPLGEKDQTLIQQTVGQHFQSHPSTEKRIWHLRGGKQEPISGVDLVNDFKNRLFRGGTETFAAFVGPLTVQEEWRHGQEVREIILKNMEIDHDAGRRLEALAAPFLGELERTKRQEYTFTVIKSDEINAFAHLGGHVYFYSGLLERLEEDSEVKFVLGHEIGHVELAHCANSSLPGIAARKYFGSFAKAPADILHKMIKLAYSEDDELDADAWAYRIMRANGASEQETLSFFYRLLRIEEEILSQRVGDIGSEALHLVFRR